MTTRTFLERKKRRVMIVVLIGFVLAAVGMIGTGQNSEDVGANYEEAEPNYAALPGLAIFFLALFYANLFAFRCPRCGGNWTALAMTMRENFFKLDPNIRYCPFCGTDIDAELDSAIK